METPQTTTPNVETVNPPVGETPNVGGNVAPPSAPVQLKDDDLVEIVWNGQKIVKPYKEAREGWQRQEDYTRGTQGISKKAKELQELYQAMTEREKQITEKEAAIDAILGRAPTKKEESNPEEVLTRAQLTEALQRERESWKTEHEKSLNETRTQMENTRRYERWEEKTQEVVSALAQEHPLLGRIPHLSEILKRQAKEFQPTSEKELMAAITKAGKKLAEDMNSEVAEQSKAAAIAKKKLVINGPEKPGGNPVLGREPKPYMKKGSRSIDFKSIENDVISVLESLED